MPGSQSAEHEVLDDRSVARRAEAGRERFTFRATAPGDATIHFVYSQPWEGGQKGAWRLDVGVTVTPPGG